MSAALALDLAHLVGGIFTVGAVLGTALNVRWGALSHGRKH